MVLNTISVCTAVAPTVIGTTISHYVYRKPLRDKPTAHFSYDLGLNLVRRFIEHSAGSTVEEIQAFTAQRVPVPRWVKVEEVEIADSFSHSAAKHLKEQLGPVGVLEAGGDKWWQWRKDYAPLKAEWIEMRQDYQARREIGSKGTRVLLYIHGGAYYFGSVDEHRYQMQRHARKLKARCLAPRYRLAPQFPFPCGLHDALAAYLFLLAEFDPKMIVVAGDSAGGGMVTSLLVLLRDQGLPQPAGAMLLSPWVDLTHSFPSICGDGKMDYIPTRGFVHRPSVAWPPPILQMDESEVNHIGNGNAKGTDGPSDAPLMNGGQPREASVEQQAKATARPKWIPKHISGHHAIPTVDLDGETTYIRDQLQLYTPNYQLLNPLVSPILNPSLGGLCPLLIQVGGGELLCDEQIYFAHKAANPTAFPPSPEIMARYDPNGEILHKYSPTKVQLQVWDDVCHVTHTLAWTKPAKYMYRSVAQFGAWALARAQKTAIDIDEGYSTSGSDEEIEYDSADEQDPGSLQVPIHISTAPNASNISRLRGPVTTTLENVIRIGKAGDPLPAFEDHMIRQRVDRNGNIYPLDPISLIAALRLAPSEIGVMKESPVHRWRERQEKWNKKYAREKAAVNKRREEMEAKGMMPGMEGETPPPTALVRRWVGEKEMKGGRLTGGDERKRRSKGVGLKWWTGWGSKQDKTTQKNKSEPPRPSSGVRPSHRRKSSAARGPNTPQRDRSKSVVDRGQADRNHRVSMSIHSSGTPFLTPQASPMSATFSLGALSASSFAARGEAGTGAGEVTHDSPPGSPGSQPFTTNLLSVPTFATGGHRRRTSSLRAMLEKDEDAEAPPNPNSEEQIQKQDFGKRETRLSFEGV